MNTYRIPVRGTSVVDRVAVGQPINGKLIAEASDLGLSVGRWPETVIVDDDPDLHGSCREGFTYSHALGGEDIAAVVYRSRSGVELHILND